MAKFKAGTEVTKSLEVSGNIVDLSGDVGTSGQILTAVESGDNEVKITASDGAAVDRFGFSVAIGNNKIVIGAYSDDNSNGFDAGAVYVYDLDGTNETKITASDGAADDQFGHSVAVGSNKIAVGVPRDHNSNGSDAGTVYVYDLDGTNETKITASDGADNDRFGHSIAIDNGKIVVGAFNASNTSGAFDGEGAVYVYNLDGTGQVKITSSDAATNQQFGSRVAIGNNKIAVTRNLLSGQTDLMSAYVYDLDGSNELKISASDATVGDKFATSVAIGNNKIVVGARDRDGNATNSGSIYVYNLDGTDELIISASDGGIFGEFGADMKVENGKIIVGARTLTVGTVTGAGAVYVYNLDGTGEVKITASDGAQSDFIGRQIAAGNGKIVVGSGLIDIGSNSSQGAAYVYDLAGTNWKTISASSSTGITNYIKCVCASATTLATSGTVSTLSWMSTTPSFSNGFSNPTATTITVPNDGLYLIGLNLDVTQTSTTNGNRYNHGFEVYINGSATGAEIRNTYIRGAANNSNHFDSSANATKTLKLSANDAITIRNRRLAGNSNSTLQLTTNSSIFVVQIA